MSSNLGELMNKPISVLIIDDNLHFLNAISEYIKEHLSNQIWVQATAQNGSDGISLARLLKPQVVLLDLKLPDMHGFIAISLLRQVLPEAKIITTTLISSEVFEQSKDIYNQKSLSAGADAFIPKYGLDMDLGTVILDLIRPITYPPVNQ